MAKLTKDWYKSRVIWKAVLIALVGVLGAVQSEYPELQLGGILVLCNSVVDLFLRLDTKTRLK